MNGPEPPATAAAGPPTALTGSAAEAGGVIATKLFAPRARLTPVCRPRLHRLLDDAVTVPLTLVIAPAGWGKSTLVADWLRRSGRPVGWVWLESSEDDPIRFWRYVLHAITRVFPAAAAPALAVLDAAGVDIDRDVLPLLVNGLAAAGTPPILLVLDDFQVVRNRAVHDQLGRVLEHRPAGLHLIMLSRVDPPLAVGRLRVRGELVEIRSGELHFTVLEAAELLRDRLGIVLSDNDIGRLVDRTEGWAAGLHLVALRLGESLDPTAFIARFTGADRHVVDYLGEEVLAGQDPAILEFLLRTSVLTRLCAPLCAEVTGRPDSGRLLDAVERANLFLTPLDDEHHWLRYHQLFRDILLHELGRTAPEQIPILHRRAALWFARFGAGDLAIGHAIAAGDHELTADLVGDAWRPTFNSGQTRTVQGWLASLPEDRVAGDPRLTAARLWLAMDAGRLDAVAAELDRVEPLHAGDEQVLLLRALHTFKAGDVGGAARRLHRPGASVDPFTRTVRTLLSGVTALWLGSHDAAADALDAAARLAARDGNRLAGVYASGCRALVAVLDGSAPTAARWLAAADTLVADAGGDRHFVAAFPALARARLALTERDWPVALASAGTAVDLADRGAGRIEQAAALLTAARAAGRCPNPNPAQAAELLGRARALLRGCADPGPVVLSWSAAEAERTGPVGRPAVPDAQSLTERELDILRLLPGPMTQRDLAATLFVSQNTLKTHLRAIYRKLGARSRVEAVLRARRTGLL